MPATTSPDSGALVRAPAALKIASAPPMGSVEVGWSCRFLFGRKLAGQR